MEEPCKRANEHFGVKISKQNIDLFIIGYYHQCSRAYTNTHTLTHIKEEEEETLCVTRKTYTENENLKGKSNPIARGLNIHCRDKITHNIFSHLSNMVDMVLRIVRYIFHDRKPNFRYGTFISNAKLAKPFAPN